MSAVRLVFYSFFAVFIHISAAFACTSNYTVQPGDTLSELALENLGSIFAYQTIYDANLAIIGDDPNMIYVGTELTIPCTVTAENPIDWSVMPTPQTLASLKEIASIQILDIRSADDVAKGVIPGSISIPYAEWRGPKENPGAPPSAERLALIIGENGLRLDQPIIIIHAKPNMMDNGRAAVVYWQLKSIGAQTMAIMRGGYKGWVDQELPVAEAPIQQESYLTLVSFSNEWRADEVDVYGIATDQIAGHLLDARPHGMFSKLDATGNALASTLPGARSAPVQPLMSILANEIDVEQGVQEVVAHLKNHEADWIDASVISFCQTGELAALNWFYASELASLDNMKLYPESVVGWKSNGGNLVAGVEEG